MEIYSGGKNSKKHYSQPEYLGSKEAPYLNPERFLLSREVCNAEVDRIIHKPKILEILGL